MTKAPICCTSSQLSPHKLTSEGPSAPATAALRPEHCPSASEWSSLWPEVSSPLGQKSLLHHPPWLPRVPGELRGRAVAAADTGKEGEGPRAWHTSEGCTPQGQDQPGSAGASWLPGVPRERLFETMRFLCRQGWGWAKTPPLLFCPEMPCSVRENGCPSEQETRLNGSFRHNTTHHAAHLLTR